MPAEENKTSGVKFPREKNGKQVRKQGGNLKSGIGKIGVALRYHKLPVYNLFT